MIDSIRTATTLALDGLFGRRYGFFDLMEEAGRMQRGEGEIAEIMAFPARLRRESETLREAA